MNEDKKKKNSQLIQALREGIGVIQMILFKELRAKITEKHPEKDSSYINMLTGAITNDIFGSVNNEPKFQEFYRENRGAIEQEILTLAQDISILRNHLTDALRIQTMCDNQEGEDSAIILSQAQKLGILVEDRELPLPSTFMTIVRRLGAKYGLLIPPAQISPEEDQSLVN